MANRRPLRGLANDPGIRERFPYKRPESVLVVVYTTAGEILLLKRRRPVFWQSVTGSLRWPDETPAAAARREVLEETGLTATAALVDHQVSRTFAILPAYRLRYEPGVSENLEHLFSLRIPRRAEIRTNPAEHTGHRWVTFDEAIALVWSWTNRDALHLVQTISASDRRCLEDRDR